MAIDPRQKRMLLRAGYTVGAVALILVCILAGQWRTVTSDAGRFRVEMPGWAWPLNVEVPTQMGTLSAHGFTVTQLWHRASYQVVMTTYPDGVLQQMSGESLLDEACDRMVSAKGGKVVASRALTMGEYAGKDVTFTASGLGTVRIRVIVVDNRLYAMSVSPVRGPRGAARADRFFNSLQLLP